MMSYQVENINKNIEIIKNKNWGVNKYNNWNKNSLEGIQQIWADKSIHELYDKSIETIQSDKQKEKRIRKKLTEHQRPVRHQKVIIYTSWES